jgi:Ku70/Ku80 beta-barrel domain
MKQAVAFVLDASPSMLKPYPTRNESDDQKQLSATTTTKSSAVTTRLDCAKQALESMISDLMLQSITNEVCVIVCKTLRTRHHKMAANNNEHSDYDDDDDEDNENNNKNVPFPNLTELTFPEGMKRPTVDLLRQIWQVQPVNNKCNKNIDDEDDTDDVDDDAKDIVLQGDIIDGVLLAADALYERTNKKKYERQIIVFTDAEHDIVMDVSQILVVIDSLRAMECKLHVIGMDFELAGVYQEPAAAPPSSTIQQDPEEDEKEKDYPDTRKKVKREENEYLDDEDQNDEDQYDDNDSGQIKQEPHDDEDDTNIIVYRTKQDREKLLVSLTEKTGGEVIAASTLQQVLDANKGKRLQTATRRKFILILAPGGLHVEARYVLLMRKTAQETIKTDAVLLRDDYTADDAHDMFVRDSATGHEVTDKIASITQFVDAESNPDIAIDPEHLTTAIRYGSDLIPMSSFDFDGLHSVYNYNTNAASISDTEDDTEAMLLATEPRMEVLGYVERHKVPNIYLQGPPYSISGNDSQRAAAAISALAQALQRLDKVAIVLFFKTRNSNDPILGALFPLQLSFNKNSNNNHNNNQEEKDEQSNKYPSHPMHLVFLQLPFAGDVKKLTMASFEQYFAATEIEEDISSENHDNQQRQLNQVQQKVQAADNLIDSLMLPDDCLRSGTVPSPYVRSWNQTKVKRAIDNTPPSTTNNSSKDASSSVVVVNVRDTLGALDPMTTPSSILQRAIHPLKEFQELFPLTVQTKKSSSDDTQAIKKGPGGRKVLTYKDFL